MEYRENKIKITAKGDFSITGMITILDLQGKVQKCKVRALLDTGAGTNFIASEVLKYVQYERITKVALSIQGINILERKNYDLVKLFLDNHECKTKEIICYVMKDLGEVGYLIDTTTMNKLMEECKDLKGLNNPLDEKVDH